MWNSINVNVDVDIDIDEIISGMSNIDKHNLICGMNAKEIRSICFEKGIIPKSPYMHEIMDYEGRKLRELLCDITGDSYHANIETIIKNLKEKL